MMVYVLATRDLMLLDSSSSAIAARGELGLAETVRSVIAVACFLPSFVIAWMNLARSRPATL